MRKRFLILLIVFLTLSVGAFVFAQETEVEYPEVPGAEKPTLEGGLSRYIVYFFNFSLLLATLIVAAVLIYGGFLYITAGGNTRRMNKGKTRMGYALIGLLILFSSYMLLNTINPDLLILRFEQLPGIPTGEEEQPTFEEVKAAQFQEIPIGTLVQNIIAKNIDCYEKENDNFNYDKMIDCQDHKEIINGHYEVEEYPRKGYCYDFDEEGNFLDANPDTEEIDPLTEHDRLECLKKLEEPVEIRMEKLDQWAKDLKEAIEECNCKNCRKEGECEPAGCGSSQCVGDPKCIGKPNQEGDPCPNRDEIKEIRKKIRRNYKDEELKKMSVDKFNELAADTPEEHGNETLLVADQVRYLLVNFLELLKKDLENDLHYLKKAEDMLKNECPYQKVFNHSQFFAAKEYGENIERIKFCKTVTGASWGEQCGEKKSVDITKHCREFNCGNCDTTEWMEEPNLSPGTKLPCAYCDLDQLQPDEAICVSTKMASREEPVTTCRCSNYLLNNEHGEDYEVEEGCETEDEKCKICRIQDLYTQDEADEIEMECQKYDDDPATFYCPEPEKVAPPVEFITTLKCTVSPKPEETYPKGQIPIGEVVDESELFAQKILDELKKINESIKKATDAVFDPDEPGQLEYPAGNPDVLYSHPLGCMCEPDPGYYPWGGDCRPECECESTEDCNCDEEGENCETVCSNCVRKCINNPSPCPIGKIDEKLEIINEAKETIEESFKRIKNLINNRNLEPGDPQRIEIINKFEQARLKMEKCMTGFEKVARPEMTKRRFINCTETLDLIQTKKLIVLPEFPIPGFANCYPYNSESADISACIRDKDGDQCQQSVQGLMDNYFCCEE